MDYIFISKTAVRLFVSVIIGALIGRERERHGRAAGIRTHILVCLGSALTGLMSLYVGEILGAGGDVFRISAQVVSGIGFLGAGMIILKENNIIMGLTTAAGVWATGIIGIAIGYGFYSGALIATILFLSTITLFTRLERRKRVNAIIYIETDDMYKTNEIIDKIAEVSGSKISYKTVPPQSGFTGHLGINMEIEKSLNLNIDDLRKIDNIVYVQEDY